MELSNNRKIKHIIEYIIIIINKATRYNKYVIQL